MAEVKDDIYRFQPSDFNRNISSFPYSIFKCNVSKTNNHLGQETAIFFWKFSTFISLGTIRVIILNVNLSLDVALYAN